MFSGLKPQILGTDSTEANCMILAKNSPMRPMINQGIQILRQTGTLDILKHKWNAQLPNADNELKTVLSAEHTAVVFFAFGVALFLSSTIFLSEVLLFYLVFNGPDRKSTDVVFLVKGGKKDFFNDRFLNLYN